MYMYVCIYVCMYVLYCMYALRTVCLVKGLARQTSVVWGV